MESFNWRMIGEPHIYTHSGYDDWMSSSNTDVVRHGSLKITEDFFSSLSQTRWQNRRLTIFFSPPLPHPSFFSFFSSIEDDEVKKKMKKFFSFHHLVHVCSLDRFVFVVNQSLIVYHTHTHRHIAMITIANDIVIADDYLNHHF